MNKQEFEKQIKACKSISKTQEEYTYGATKVIQKYANENHIDYGRALEVYKEVINNIKQTK